MMIEIADTDFTRLKALAEPLVDTPATVIARLLDYYENNRDDEPKVGTEKKPLPGLTFDVPPLTHTKILMAKFNGREPDRLTWDALLRLALEEAWKKDQSFESLRTAAGANMVEGSKSDSGYKFLPSLGISYQGVSAEDAMRIIRRLCEYLWTECEFKFEWRDKPDAFMPRQRAYGHIGGGLLKISWNNSHADA